MPDIHLRRDHALGFEAARALADRWVVSAERDYGLRCEVERGAALDTVRFARTGVDGRMTVSADHFELDARLGFLLGGFAARIEAEIRQNLDRMLAEAPAPGTPVRPASGARRSRR